MSLLSFKVDNSPKCEFDLRNIKNWDDIVGDLAYCLPSFREFKNINASPTLKPKNKAEIKFSCTKKDGPLVEFILLFDVLGCKDHGYNSEISKAWRECLEVNFGEAYHNYVVKELGETTGTSC